MATDVVIHFTLATMIANIHFMLNKLRSMYNYNKYSMQQDSFLSTSILVIYLFMCGCLNVAMCMPHYFNNNINHINNNKNSNFAAVLCALTL